MFGCMNPIQSRERFFVLVWVISVALLGWEGRLWAAQQVPTQSRPVHSGPVHSQAVSQGAVHVSRPSALQGERPTMQLSGGNKQVFQPLLPSLLTDQDGQPIVLPPVCTSELPGYAYELPAGTTGVPQTGAAMPVPVPLPGGPAKAAQDQQWRDLLQQLVESDGTYDGTAGADVRLASYQASLEASQAAQASHSQMPLGSTATRAQQAAQYKAVAAGYSPDVVAMAGSGAAVDPDQAMLRQLYNPHAQASADRAAWQRAKNDPKGLPGTVWEECDVLDPHAALFAKTLFPSATECAACHQQIFDEWASSSHAYASISPMFHRFEDTINKLANGTIGYFCMRCHAPVATTVGHRRDMPIWDGPRVFREGVTCIACHHIQEVTLKTNGERRIEPGTLVDPVTGASSGDGIATVHKYADHFKVKSDPEDKRNGQLMHRRVFQFKEISESTFCVSCHQVAVQPGIKLEVVWDQYRGSPAHREGITCQDCHMGIVPGAAEGYSLGPTAVVEGRVVEPLRKHSNHMFYGPGYSIAHPGTFPHDPAQDKWTFNEWLEFDWRAGWGTDAFEDHVAQLPVPPYFPPAWQSADDRYDAREVVDRNLKKLAYKKEIRRQVLENGSRIDGPYFESPLQVGQDLEFNYCVQNTSKGHNMPSGSLGAQPQLWLNVVLIGPDGCRIWESGYLDSQGDLADMHSADVLNGRVPADLQLFNLQTKFLTTNVKGTDREMYLPINVDIDQLPYIRPAPQPVTVINHPPFIRMEAHSIPALGQRKARYRVPGHLIQQPGTYRLSVRLRSRAEPIYFMKFVKATPEMIRSMNEWIADAHAATVVFEVQ